MPQGVEQRPRGDQPRNDTPRLRDVWIGNTITHAFKTAGLGDVKAIPTTDRTTDGEPKIRFSLPGDIVPDAVLDEREVMISGAAEHINLFKSILGIAKRKRIVWEEHAEMMSKPLDYQTLGEMLEQNIEFTLFAHKLVAEGASETEAITTIGREDLSYYMELGLSTQEAKQRVASSSSFATNVFNDQMISRLRWNS